MRVIALLLQAASRRSLRFFLSFSVCESRKCAGLIHLAALSLLFRWKAASFLGLAFLARSALHQAVVIVIVGLSSFQYLVCHACPKAPVIRLAELSLAISRADNPLIPCLWHHRHK